MRRRRSRDEAGFSLVEVTVALFLLMTIAVFGLQTMTAAWMSENWSIMQSMTDAYAAIETANAQRWTFGAIASSNRWPVYPNSATTTAVPIGQTPSRTVTATVTRTCRSNIDPVTNAQSYLLESYVLYKDGLRQYFKVSKVYRDQ
jgi:Tfp pilus assembly protein PilV